MHQDSARFFKSPSFFILAIVGIAAVSIFSAASLYAEDITIQQIKNATWYPQGGSLEESLQAAPASGGWLSGQFTSSQSSGLAVRESAQIMARADSLGFSVGGAKDIDNFRKNIENGFLPLVTDITYEGLFYDYYFDTGVTKQCDKLFCPSYSYAISPDPLSEENQYYLSVGLNSGIKESDFERKKLNLVIVLDVSGSMSSAFDKYYYDQFGNRHALYEHFSPDDSKTKMQLAAESVSGLLDHLNDDDRLGIVLFNNGAHLAKPLESMAITDKDTLKGQIMEIFARGGTNMAAGMTMATSLFDEDFDYDASEYENRIIFLTDAMPNLGDISEDGLLGMLKKNSENQIYTTFIGIGLDFNTELVETITKVRGANYYSVHSASDFKKRMVDEFEFMVTPLVFDLVLKLESDGYDILQVYGSPEANESTGEIMKVNTLFPSAVEDGKTKGGIVVLKLEKTSDDGSIVLSTSYENRVGMSDGDSVTVNFAGEGSEYYENLGIRKGILLTRYADLMKSWAFDERQAWAEKTPIITPAFYEDGIAVSEFDHYVLGKWERQSVPLHVDEGYQKAISDFGDYFKRELTLVDDFDLVQEVAIMEKLVDFA